MKAMKPINVWFSLTCCENPAKELENHLHIHPPAKTLFIYWEGASQHVTQEIMNNDADDKASWLTPKGMVIYENLWKNKRQVGTLIKGIADR